MISERVRQGMAAGSVAAAATAGALVGFGIRGRPASRPFMEAGRALLGHDAILTASSGAIVLGAGILLHIVAMLVLGVCFSLVAAGLRGVRLLLAASVFSALVFVAVHRLLPLPPAPGLMTGWPTPRLVIIYVTLALALTAGMRLARPTVHGR
ncbi:MAG TPA: hypothetical protein VFG84_01785 [Gemmatimonadaceae bacterium]|nr:hypothetical protein [Gemmatimonadaceae bacterium]